MGENRPYQQRFFPRGFRGPAACNAKKPLPGPGPKPRHGGGSGFDDPLPPPPRRKTWGLLLERVFLKGTYPRGRYNFYPILEGVTRGAKITVGPGGDKKGPSETPNQAPPRAPPSPFWGGGWGGFPGAWETFSPFKKKKKKPKKKGIWDPLRYKRRPSHLERGFFPFGERGGKGKKIFF